MPRTADFPTKPTLLGVGRNLRFRSMETDVHRGHWEVPMNRLIYVHADGEYDRARWLQMEHRSNEQICLYLQDLCHPGRLSQLTHVNCPLDFLQAALEGTPIQVTTQTGYLLVRRQEENLLLFEFRGLDDIARNKVTLRASDVAEVLTAITCGELTAN